MFEKLNIRGKIMIPVLSLTIILLTSFVSYTYFLNTENRKEEIIREFEATTQLKTLHLQTVFELYRERAMMITSKTWLKNYLEEYLETSSDESLASLRDILLETQANNSKFLRILIIGVDGKIITSTNDQLINNNVSNEEWFIKSKNDYILSDFYETKNDGSRIYTAGPLYKNEKLIGVVAIGSNGISINEAINTNSDTKTSVETYLINSEGYMVTPSSFKEDVYLKEKVVTIIANTCFDHTREEGTPENHTAITKDYRGIDVLGTHSFIRGMNWCLINEIDESEIMTPIKKELTYTTINTTIVLLLFSIILNIIVKMISKPVSELLKGVSIIMKGNLDYKVGTKAKDEIGKLSRGFDKMIESLKKSRANIENKVKKQVKRIEENEYKMERQQKALLSIMEDMQEKNVITTIERDKNKIILDNIGDGVFVIDTQLNLVLINKVALSLCGYKSSSKVVGEKYNKILKFFNEKTGEKDSSFIDKAISTGKIQNMDQDIMLIRSDGKKIPVSDSAALLKDYDGKAIGCVVVFRDITQERIIDKTKTEFISLASHQLRTPLSIVKWYSETLLEDVKDFKDDQKEYLEEIHDGNQRMIKLVNALLNVSRLELGTFTIQPELLSITKIADRTIKEFSLLLKEKNIKFTKKYDELSKINLDEVLTHIIFQNLMSNAIKYTPIGGNVDLKIIHKKNKIEVSIKDNGMGIPKKQQGKIFTKLFRTDKVKKENIEGTGLGLYIVKSILDNCGGKIWFKSKEDKGSTFYVSFPIKGMRVKEGTKQLS